MGIEDHYKRSVQTSVTNFVYHRSDYLFMKRSSEKEIDPGRLNGIGGRLEPGEDYLSAAIRETAEETGYVVIESQIQFCGLMKLVGGYEEDWVVAFFKIAVPDKTIPHGTHTPDGELMWLPADSVLGSGFELVDDLHYCFEDVVKGADQFFLTVRVNEQHKIVEHSMRRLSVR